MARQEVVTLVDDLDGSAAEETVRFGLDGETYEIDLSRSNARKLRDALAVYINAARRVRGRGRPARRAAGATRRGRRAAATSGGAARTARATAKKAAPARRGRASRAATSASPAQIREWARSQGIPVNERGRISAEVIQAYNAAH
ncbi:MAG: Lsr2 family protein [Acidothermus sp.]|nr:Lsr2 family protein [Acidothermus sp.]MCL6537698.1 Lsr2 family protein [Acidothermus sp.]